MYVRMQERSLKEFKSYLLGKETKRFHKREWYNQINILRLSSIILQ